MILSSETSVHIQTTQHYVPEGANVHNYRCGNLTFCINKSAHIWIHALKTMAFRGKRAFILYWGQPKRLKSRKKISKIGFNWTVTCISDSDRVSSDAVILNFISTAYVVKFDIYEFPKFLFLGLFSFHHYWYRLIWTTPAPQLFRVVKGLQYFDPACVGGVRANGVSHWGAPSGDGPSWSFWNKYSFFAACPSRLYIEPNLQLFYGSTAFVWTLVLVQSEMTKQSVISYAANIREVINNRFAVPHLWKLGETLAGRRLPTARHKGGLYNLLSTRHFQRL
jgi:hypothetical protein